MSAIPMLQGGGGEPLVETVLWTNPSPSSGFSAQTVTLSDSLSNYDYVKFKWQYNTASPTKLFEDLVPVSQFKQTVTQAYGNRHMTSVNSSDSTFYYFDRAYVYQSDTTIAIGSCFRYDTTFGHATVNEPSATIPLQIIGVKKTNDAGGIKETLVNVVGSRYSLIKNDGTIYSSTTSDTTVVNNNSEYFEMYFGNSVWNFKVKKTGKYSYYSTVNGASGIVTLTANQIVTHNPFNNNEYFMISKLVD